MPYDRLLSPIIVGPRTLRNRQLVTAHVPGLAVDGVPGPAYAAYQRARAGGVIAAGAMDAALSMGLDLEIVTPQFMVAEDTDVVQRIPRYERLLSRGATFHPNCEVASLTDGKVRLRNVYSFQASTLGPVDLVVAWNGRTAQDALHTSARELGIEAHLTGDSLAPRTAEFAIAEGAMVARSI